jgi:hypothetical protein
MGKHIYGTSTVKHTAQESRVLVSIKYRNSDPAFKVMFLNSNILSTTVNSYLFCEYISENHNTEEHFFPVRIKKL